MGNFREEIGRNRWKLRVFLVAYFALALVAGRTAGKALQFTVNPDAYYAERGFDTGGPVYSGPFSYPNLMAVAVVLLAFTQYRRMWRGGDRVVLSMVGAKPLREMQLENVGEELAIAAGINAPRLYVVEDDSMNAFACGAKGDRASIAVTRGLLNRMDRDELQAVIAHETAHVRNGDTKLMTLLFGLSQSLRLLAAFALGPIYAIKEGMAKHREMPHESAVTKRSMKVAEFVKRHKIACCFAAPLLGAAILFVSLIVSVTIMGIFTLIAMGLPALITAYAIWDYFHEPKLDKPAKKSGLMRLAYIAPVGLIVGPAILTLGILFPFVFFMLRLAVSRNREFQADATAVELTRNPDALKSALERIRDDDPHRGDLKPALTPLLIAPPPREFPLPAFLSTHPPLNERIARVAEMTHVREPVRLR